MQLPADMSVVFWLDVCIKYVSKSCIYMVSFSQKMYVHVCICMPVSVCLYLSICMYIYTLYNIYTYI